MFNRSIIVPNRDMKMVSEYPVTKIAAKTRMIIPQGYEVVLIDGDQCEVYPCGEHMFNKSRPGPLSLFFVNKVVEVKVGFEANDLGLYLFDSYLRMPIEVRVDGLTAFRVVDSLKLISQFPDAESINGKSLFEMFKPIIYMEMKTALAKLMEPESVNIFNTTLLLKEVSEELHETLRSVFSPAGVELSRFLITGIRTTNDLKKILDEEYQEIQRQTIRDVYYANKEIASLAAYEKKANIYKESGYCGLTETEKDNEAKRAAMLADANAESAYSSTPVPVSPMVPQHVSSNTIYRAPEVNVQAPEDTVRCSVCGQPVSKDKDVCDFCLSPIVKEA